MKFINFLIVTLFLALAHATPGGPPAQSTLELTAEVSALMEFVAKSSFEEDTTIRNIRIGPFHSKIVEFVNREGKCTALVYHVKFEKGESAATITLPRMSASCLPTEEEASFLSVVSYPPPPPRATPPGQVGRIVAPSAEYCRRNPRTVGCLCANAATSEETYRCLRRRTCIPSPIHEDPNDQSSPVVPSPYSCKK